MAMEKNIYSRARVSVKALDVFIALGILALAFTIVYLSVTGGFDISFDSLGGSEVASQRLRYGELIEEPLAPTREGHLFLGWYEDRELTKEVDFSSAVATKNTTIYAAWEQIG